MRLPVITAKTRILITVVAVVSIASLTVAYFYYKGVNEAVDPRVAQTRYMFERYNKKMQGRQYDSASRILDSVQEVFDHTPGYSESVEMGVVLNNRSALYISKALYGHDPDSLNQILFNSALRWNQRCIEHYTRWIEAFGKLNKEQITSHVKPFFTPSDKAFAEGHYQKIAKKRVSDLMDAQQETPRRLSVAYTNRGVIMRHQGRTVEAMNSYMKAIELWPDNPQALSNLNVLAGGKPQNRSFLKKLFPPERIQ
jgi:tetratricopeptide (TPR) repeat protein